MNSALKFVNIFQFLCAINKGTSKHLISIDNTLMSHYPSHTETIQVMQNMNSILFFDLLTLYSK